MDNLRVFLVLALAYTGFLLWQAWQEDYGPQRRADTAPTAHEGQAVPEVPARAEVDRAATPEVGKADEAAKPAARLVEVVTDTFRMHIDTRGGTIVDVWLQKYPVSVDRPEEKYHLLSRDPDDFFIAQSGLLAAVGGEAPTHEALFTVEKSRYELAEGAETLTVDLVWQGAKGLKVVKRYLFMRDSHLVRLQHIVVNEGEQAWHGREYHQFQRGEPQGKGNALLYTYTGGVVWDPEEKYQKFDFDALAAGELDKDVTGGWIAMIQHYFLGAVIPPKSESRHFYGRGLANGRYVIGEYSRAREVASGQRHVFEAQLYLGPKDQETLAEIAEGLDLVVDYGWLTMLAKPIYQILSWINSIVGNWGWTIIIFTILIKAVFFKLSETSYRSMAKMRNLTPRIQALKDRYGDDKQRMQQAMMELYKKEKINPLGGCLPILIQMPFFIALYWVLMESVELRQAPWILWIKDLSEQDPYYVLPIVMGITMFVQQKLNPPPPDPMQEKLLMALPFVFTVMFAFFPSGLVLYWTVNNILSIAQQWVITRRIEAQAKKL